MFGWQLLALRSESIQMVEVTVLRGTVQRGINVAEPDQAVMSNTCRVYHNHHQVE